MAVRYASCGCSPAREDWTVRNVEVDEHGGTRPVYVCLTCGAEGGR